MKSNLPKNPADVEFMPPIRMAPGLSCELHVNEEDGRARMRIIAFTGHIIEMRPECQWIEEGEKKIVIAAPGSIERPRLGLKLRFLLWLARGRAKYEVLASPSKREAE
jgi:hypothetical protein